MTRTIRGIRSEVEIGRPEGVSRDSVVNTDEIVTVETSLVDPDPIGALGPVKLRELEEAIRYALDLQH